MINRDLYHLIISQLQHDGMNKAAEEVCRETMIPISSVDPNHKNKLYTLLQHLLDREKDINFLDIETENIAIDSIEDHATKTLDLDLGSSPPPPIHFPNFTTKFITTHKGPCRIATFSPDGKYVATGSTDNSIKLLDVMKMKSFNETKQETTDDFAPTRPVVRTFYDHSQPISCLDFHPVFPVLASSSKDSTIRLYELSVKASQKRAFKCIQDTHPVRCVNFHPTGEYLIAGTEHTMLRIYDMHTLQAFVSRHPSDHHFGPITMARYGSEGNIYATCSKDGAIKLWDGVNNSVIHSFVNAHSGAEVNSIQFTKNQKYLLSCGKDATVRLWEISTGKQITRLIATHLQNPGVQQKARISATFNYTEEFIYGSDENTSTVLVWDSRSGDLVQKLSGHNQVVRYVATSPVDTGMMTCSDDFRARFWTDDNIKS
eukprot:TRINITY_DN4523_c0_g1_i1.p1 TRINITY_DN4523_c0_g1~~TRINITY_DN4523_c0_g1_i1.p1  ORF type:complete len:430 (+),score=108.75 TRINITY_DN4523_c0_g1_i1:43-1332(+)